LTLNLSPGWEKTTSRLPLFFTKADKLGKVGIEKNVAAYTKEMEKGMGRDAPDSGQFIA